MKKKNRIINKETVKKEKISKQRNNDEKFIQIMLLNLNR